MFRLIDHTQQGLYFFGKTDQLYIDKCKQTKWGTRLTFPVLSWYCTLYSSIHCFWYCFFYCNSKCSQFFLSVFPVHIHVKISKTVANWNFTKYCIVDSRQRFIGLKVCCAFNNNDNPCLFYFLFLLFLPIFLVGKFFWLFAIFLVISSFRRFLTSS